MIGPRAQPPKRAQHGDAGGLQDVDPVDLGCRRDADPPVVEVVDQCSEAEATLPRGELLGVVDPLGETLRIDYRDRGDDRTEQRAATGLVEPRNPAGTGLSEVLLERLYWVRFSLMRAALPRRLRR
jgi:hypothetical protein